MVGEVICNLSSMFFLVWFPPLDLPILYADKLLKGENQSMFFTQGAGGDCFYTKMSGGWALSHCPYRDR